MNGATISSGDMCEIISPTGVTPKTLSGWLDRGIICPAEGGGSRGTHRRFTLMQTVGVYVAGEVFQSERSCAASYLTLIVEAFMAVDEKWLTQQFRNGRTKLALVRQGKPILAAEGLYGWPDVEAAYKAVKKAIAEMSEEPVNQTGRNRGLAGAASRYRAGRTI